MNNLWNMFFLFSDFCQIMLRSYEKYSRANISITLFWSHRVWAYGLEQIVNYMLLWYMTHLRKKCWTDFQQYSTSPSLQKQGWRFTAGLQYIWIVRRLKTHATISMREHFRSQTYVASNTRPRVAPPRQDWRGHLTVYISPLERMKTHANETTLDISMRQHFRSQT